MRERSTAFFVGKAKHRICAGLKLEHRAITMLVAIFSVHVSNGLFLTNNGYEYALALFAMTTALAIQGAGRLSVDSLLQSQLFHGRQ